MERKKLNSNIKIIIALLLLAIFVSYPLFTDYMIWQHDLDFHLKRVENIKDGLLEGQFPVRIHPTLNNKYGYATPTMYPELFLYIPAILRIIGLSLVSSYKILLVLINIIAVFSMFYCVKKISKNNVSGIIAACIFAAANYRLTCLYPRGALGESIAFSFLPLAFLGLYEVFVGNRKNWYLLVIGATGILQSHIISTFLFAILSIVFAIVCAKNIIKEKRFKEIIISLVAVVLLNAWFLIPFAQSYFNKDYVMNIKANNNAYVFYDHALFPAQFFNIFEKADSYKLSIPLNEGTEDEMGFSLGILVTAGLIISIIYCFKNRKKKDDKTRIIKFATFFGLIILICSTTLFPWKPLIEGVNIIAHITASIQFPWRLLGICTMLISIASSLILGEYIVMKYDSNKNFFENFKVLIIIVIVTFLVIPYYLEVFSKKPVYFTDSSILPQTMKGNPEYFLVDTNYEKIEKSKRVCVSSSGIKVNEFYKMGSDTYVEYKSDVSDGYIDVPLLYYPIYHAKDENNKEVELTTGDNNVIRIKVNDEKTGKIVISPKDRGVVIVADIISLLSFIAFVTLIVLINKKGHITIKPQKSDQ